MNSDKWHAHTECTVPACTAATLPQRASRFRLGDDEYLIFTLSPAERLSSAEEEIARAMAAGRTNEQIARARGTAARTVANQVVSVFRKLGVGCRAELVALFEIDAMADSVGPQHVAQPTAGALRRAAVIAVESARGPIRRRDADEALLLWRAMVEGEWALSDRFERDGRRFFVARRNRLTPRDVAGLSRREREVVSLAALGYSNKLIAYALGTSRSTVTTHMRNAGTKLGAQTRSELIRSWFERTRTPGPGEEAPS